MRAYATVAAALLFLGTALSRAEATPKVRYSGDNPVAISGLAPKDDCHPIQASGRVVQRKFDRNGILMESVTIEGGNGARTFINVDSFYIGKFDAVTKGEAVRGMQVLLREGSRVRLDLFSCGAAGRVLMLNGVSAQR